MIGKSKSRFREVMLLILLFWVPLGYSNASELPWDDKGKFEAFQNRVVFSTGFITPLFGDTVAKSLVNRFGAFPNTVVWEDAQNDPVLKWTAHFIRYSTGAGEPVPTAPWGLKITWGEVKDHLFWRLKRAENDSIVFLPMQGPPDTTNITMQGEHYNGWGWLFTVHLRDFPIPNDGSAWDLRTAVFEGQPKEGNEVFLSEDHIVVIRTTRSTPIDTFLCAQMERKLRKKDVLLTLLPHFPNSQMLMLPLLHIYDQEGNCDSLRALAGRYLYYAGQGIDPLVGHREGMPAKMHVVVDYADTTDRSPYTIDFIRDALYRTCGDSTFPVWQPGE